MEQQEEVRLREPVVVRAGRTRNTQCGGWPQRELERSLDGRDHRVIPLSRRGVLEAGATPGATLFGIHTPNSVLIALFLSPPQPQCLVLTGPPTSARPWWTLWAPSPGDLSLMICGHVLMVCVLCREGGAVFLEEPRASGPPPRVGVGWGEVGARRRGCGAWTGSLPFLFLSLASPHCLTPHLLPPSSSWPSPCLVKK